MRVTALLGVGAFFSVLASVPCAGRADDRGVSAPRLGRAGDRDVVVSPPRDGRAGDRGASNDLPDMDQYGSVLQRVVSSDGFSTAASAT